MTRGVCFSCLNPGQMYGDPKGSICQNTKQCLKAQTSFQKHKSAYRDTKQFLKNTNQFLKAQINLPKHKTVSQNTNQFPEKQFSLPKHKTISQNTNRFPKTQTKRLGTCAVIIRESLYFPHQTWRLFYHVSRLNSSCFSVLTFQ